jgi:hypothetical protein
LVEGDRNAEPVVLGESLKPGDEVAVVEDIMMRERRAFGVAGRPAGVLDVGGIVELLVSLALGELFR